MVVFTNVSTESVLRLLKKGYTRESIKTVHEEVRLKKGNVTLVLYTSGKLLVQGNLSEVKKSAIVLRKMGLGKEQKQEEFRKEKGWIIGSDETLKGDTFGGLVVAAVKAEEKGRAELIKLGVADSKTLSDKEILPMAEKIKRIAACEVRSILPEEYNKHEGKITPLLNKLHEEAFNYLAPGKHIVDKYPGCTVGNIQAEKAESKYVEVAAASVLARAAALQQLDYLSMEAGFSIPKGSTHVQLALHELAERKLEFRKFVKLNFSNVQEFISGIKQ